MDSLQLREGNEELLENIRPLWEKLNEHHYRISAHFSSEFVGRSFEDRRAVLSAKAASGKLKIFVVNDPDTSKDIGYCVASISGDLGEIDSIFIEEAYRRHGVGDMLMKAALKWMEDQAVKDKIIAVAAGNDQALVFYRRYGFLPRMMLLKQSRDSSYDRI